MDAIDFVPQDWREWRRMRALQLKQQGWYQRGIAEALGVSEVTVSRWMVRARDDGPEALLCHPAPGHPPKLAPAQKRLIPDFLWHGPEAYGFRGRSGPVPASPRSSPRSSVSPTIRTTSPGCFGNCTGRPRCLSRGPSSVTKRPSSAGVMTSGQSCDDEHGVSAERWFSWTKPARFDSASISSW